MSEDGLELIYAKAMAFDLTSGAFCDLAVAFSRLDRNAAARAVTAQATLLAKHLTAHYDEPPEGIDVAAWRTQVRAVGIELRATMRSAHEQIAAADHPKPH